jgi:hypothetical protein
MSKFQPPATPGDVVRNDQGELRKPDDRADQPGQGADLTPALQQQRGDGVPSPEEIEAGSSHGREA